MSKRVLFDYILPALRKADMLATDYDPGQSASPITQTARKQTVVTARTITDKALATYGLPNFLSTDGATPSTITAFASVANPLSLSFADGVDAFGSKDVVETSVTPMTYALTNPTGYSGPHFLYAERTAAGVVALGLADLNYVVNGFPVTGTRNLFGQRLTAPHAMNWSGDAAATTGTGTAIAGVSGGNAWTYPYRAFGWHGRPAAGENNYTFRNTPTGTCYIGYRFNAATVIRYVGLVAPTIATASNGGRRDSVQYSRMPSAYTIDGSNDGAAWTTLYTGTRTTATVAYLLPFEEEILDTANATAYLYYRLNITGYLSGAMVAVGPINLYAPLSATVGPDTFDIPTFTMSTPSGVKKHRVYLGVLAPTTTGQVTTANLLTYAVGGRYLSPWAALARNAYITLNHNLGCTPAVTNLWTAKSSADARRFHASGYTTTSYGTAIAEVSDTQAFIESGASFPYYGILGNYFGTGTPPGYAQMYADRGW
jgi:hypothetical protein